MVLVRYVGQHPAVIVGEIGREVARGETVEVPLVLADALCAQRIWQRVEAAKSPHEMTVAELRELLAGRGVATSTKARKDDLIELALAGPPNEEGNDG